MSPLQKSLAALTATALFAGVGYATAQSVEGYGSPQAPSSQTSSNTAAPQMLTTTTVDTTTQVIPAPATGVQALARPRGTLAPTTKQANGPLGMQNTVLTTGLSGAATRPSVGEQATPPLPGADTAVAVTTERTTTMASNPLPAVAPETAPPTAAGPEAAPPAAEPAPMPAPVPSPMPMPRADRN